MALNFSKAISIHSDGTTQSKIGFEVFYLVKTHLKAKTKVVNTGLFILFCNICLTFKSLRRLLN